MTVTSFSRVNNNLLATSSRDQVARVFDLRMMRDICILRGHEKPISSLTWHPQHSSLISTGSEDGSLYHYLLDEPNLPNGQVPTVAPYDSSDPMSTPPQVIYPAHRIQYAHSGTIWSLDWHPLGHIMASGSKDNFARFWSRARPGETGYMKDRFHIGEEAAEAQGTWNRGFGRWQMREEEEQEIQDEADSLADQKTTPLPGLPGIQPQTDAALPGIGFAQPPPPPSHSAPSLAESLAQADPTRLAALLSSSQPLPQANTTTVPGFPLAPPMNGIPQLNFDLAGLQKQLQNLPNQSHLPTGTPPMGLPGLQGIQIGQDPRKR